MAYHGSLRLAPNKLRWRRSQSIDITTGAPQKLFRHLQDGLRGIGYHEISTVQPSIHGQAIADTGTTHGMIIGEKGPFDIRNPWVAVRALGAVMLVIGLVWLLWILMMSTDRGSPLAFLGDGRLFFQVVFSLVLIIGGAIMARAHRYKSNLMWIDLRGEVYRSALSAGTDMRIRSASSNRLSIVSELRLAVMGSSVVSKKSGKGREILKVDDSQDLLWEYDNLMHTISANILPKVVLQKSTDMRRQEVESEVLPPPPPETIKERQIVCVICRYCDSLVPQGSRACPSCGSTSYF